MRCLRYIIITLMLISALYPRIDIGDKNGISVESGHIVITMPAEEYCELYSISKEPLY